MILNNSICFSTSSILLSFNFIFLYNSVLYVECISRVYRVISTSVRASFPIVGARSGLLTEDRLKNGAPFQPFPVAIVIPPMIPHWSVVIILKQTCNWSFDWSDVNNTTMTSAGVKRLQ
jgi:hypothetical protein